MCAAREEKTRFAPEGPLSAVNSLFCLPMHTVLNGMEGCFPSTCVYLFVTTAPAVCLLAPKG